MSDMSNTISIEAEQSVLGALLADPLALDRVTFLQAEHFYRPEHRVIFAEILRLVAANQAIDPMTVADKVSGRVEDALAYLGKLRAVEPTGARVRGHADIVVEKAKCRDLLALTTQIQDAVAGQTDVREIADMVVGRIEALVRSSATQEPQRMATMMSAYCDTLEGRHTGAIKPVSTGLTDLDKILGGGLDRGTLNIVAARPAMGKTAFGLGLARHIAMDDGISTFLSMEMARDQVIDRNISAMAQIPLAWLRCPDSNTDYWNRFTATAQRVNDMGLFIDDQTGLNMMAIRAKARKVKRSAGRLDMLVIDQLSFIVGSKLERRHEQVSEYTRSLLALGKELDCPIVLLCQLSRKCEERPNKRPMLSDLAESGAIEQDADTIIFLYRDEVYNPESPDRGTAEAIVAKKRQGSTGMARLTYVGAQTRFDNLSHSWRPELRPEQYKIKKRGFD
ncbi:replicative DNA helicase [Massilia endophytica]|uniref:replicative DNA helicase n=1 Tax=Massilia endophytica TaxID=2899220 RepID=UPI001E5B33EE|nr:replicative DNA helicase [Massilia endophytica]UGQ44958.1 replicative DNA helicase [Massilia endophytica]